MKKPIAGIVIAVVLVLIALIAYGCSHVSVRKKSDATQSSVSSSVSGTSTGKSKTEVSDQVESKPTETVDGKVLLSCKEPTLNGTNQVSTGVVTAKRYYIDGSQFVYQVDINVTMGTEVHTVCYYCTYSTFEALNIDDVLQVTYQAVSDSTFVLVEVSR